MNTNQILSDLRSERDLLNQVITALEALGSTGVTAARRGRPPATATQPTPGHRTMSAAGRKRISEAAKKRWARLRAISEVKGSAAKKAAKISKNAAPAKPAAKKAAPARKGMSPSARKRMSDAAKARWAAKKAVAKTA